jgi:Conserved TM helix
MLFESSTLLQSLRRSLLRFADALPDLVLALALLIAGWLVAKLVRRLLIRIMRAGRVDEFAERSGLDDFLVRGGVEHTTVTIVAGTVYWLILAAVFITLLDALGLRTAEVLLERLGIFFPNLIVAIGILVFGSLLARVIGGLVFSYLSNVGSAAAAPIGALARYALLVFTLFMAAEQLAIATEVLVSAFQIAFAALCLAAALAFGLGGRDWAAGVIARYTRK